ATLSSYEKKDKLEQDILEKIAKVLDIPVEAITELGEDSAINIVASTLTANDNAAIINYYPSFNPIDKIVELYDKLLQSEKEKVEMLQEVLRDKK
ncbi:MAG TPA: XRE family transcriptional regulator, partial [Dysgonomonas sp.]